MNINRQLIIILSALLFATSCAHAPFPGLPKPLDSDVNSNQAQASQYISEEEAARLETGFSDTPDSRFTKKEPLIDFTDDGPVFKGEDLVLNAENMSLPAFINEVFGNLLGVNFVLDPRLQKQKDRVTLRVTEPQSAEELYNLSRKVLLNYGIEVIQDDQILRVSVANKKGQSSVPPLLISGSALPTVPLSHRPIFQLVQLKVVRSGQILGWLSKVYAGSQLKIQDSQQRNAIILQGSDELVREAVRAIEFFDKPFMRGRHSIRIEPAFISAKELAPLLVDVLIAQGYGAGKSVTESGSVLVIPIEKSNIVLVFATDMDALAHAQDWAKTLDKPNLQAGSSSLFFYPVQNTRADSIAQILNGLVGKANTTQASQGGQTPEKEAKPAHTGGIMVDEDRNALLYRGEPSEWERLMQLIKKMDVPAKQVMIEVTIAEVSLTEGETFGIEWFASGSNGRFNSNISSKPTANLGGVGLNWVLDVAGETSAVLNAFANDSRVNILSTPRLLVKTGKEANLNVVTEIPTVIGRSNSNQQTGGNTEVLEEIVYRKTGIILKIEPVVHAGNRIDIDVSQEVSEALPLSSGGTADSPAIFTRNVTTSLSLHSGGSVLLAGLISNRETYSDGGVPLLKDIPVLGNAFKSTSRDTSRTELVVMLVPYIINNENDAKSITDSLISELELIGADDQIVQ